MNIQRLQLYIDGQFADAEDGKVSASHNPADGTEVALVAIAGVRDAERAIAAARKAFDAGPWRTYSGADRKRLLEKLADGLKQRQEEFALQETLDAGALLVKARSDVGLCVAQLRYFARMAEHYDSQAHPIEGQQRQGKSFLFLQREPIGVCGQIIPWNFPLPMAIWKIGAALATGNTLVLKCAPETPVTALMLAQLCHEAGFPAGVVNFLTGDVEVGETIVKNRLVDKVAFTGSTEVGRLIMANAAPTLKRLTLECGGKSANLVLDDADPELAVDGSLYATFFHSGQVCESGTRLLVSTAKRQAFVDRLAERTEKLRIGDPRDPDTNFGPLVSQAQLDRVLKYIDIGNREGARLVTGGHRAQSGALGKGFYVEPTIFDGVTNTMRIAREEIFGPVLSILDFETVDQAIELANDSDYGLAAGVWSRDNDAAISVAKRLRAGWVWINEWHVLNSSAPFGGYKQSGMGREFGEDGLNCYTEVKSIYQDDIKVRAAKPWYDVVVPQNS